MIELFHSVSESCSRIVTKKYSTSFASAIRLLHRDLRTPIFSIYGFVRFADEIVDSFHSFEKDQLLAEFKRETFEAIKRGISLNPILNSFQRTVNEFNIDHALIHSFFHSMETDLSRQVYDQDGFNEYVYGSSEVVGLMCLYVFVEGRRERYEELQSAARSLGAAFQKVNFLRDMKADYATLSRIYFPGCDSIHLQDCDKKIIEENIRADFRHAYRGILKLPLKARFGVYVAYKYYFSLFKKITRIEARRVLEERVRIPNYHKLMIILRAGVKNQLKLIGDEN